MNDATYFLAAAVLLRSWYLAVAAVVFAIGHLYMSYQSLQAVRDGGSAL